MAHVKAIWRHVSIVPNVNTIRNPNWCDTSPRLAIVPRMFGSLFRRERIKNRRNNNEEESFYTKNWIHSKIEIHQISHEYRAAGDSLIPIQNPIAAKQKQTIENDWANPSRNHVNASGMVSIKSVVRRPNLSQTMPLSKLPIGWTMNEHMAEEGKNTASEIVRFL